MSRYGKCAVKCGELFAKAWTHFCKALKALTAFCAAIASVFPRTGIMACEFSGIKLKKKDYHENHLDLGLEGILQSKQFGVLKELRDM